jgi:hypothetical protein
VVEADLKLTTGLRSYSILGQLIGGVIGAILLTATGIHFGNSSAHNAESAAIAVRHAQVDGRASTTGYNEDNTSPNAIPVPTFKSAEEKFGASAVIADQTTTQEFSAAADRFQNYEVWGYGGAGATLLIFLRGLMALIEVAKNDRDFYRAEKTAPPVRVPD